MPFLYRVEDETPEDVHVYIKKSKIKGAKKGIFAAEKIKKGEVACLYMGVFVPMCLIELNYYDSDYLFQSPNEVMAIDASDVYSCYGRYANDSLSLQKINVKFTKSINEDSANLVAIRDIKKNEEIYVSYGEAYWTEGDRIQHLSQVDQDFITSGQLKDYIDTIGVEEDSEEEEEKYDSD